MVVQFCFDGHSERSRLPSPPPGLSCKLFPLHTWLNFLYIVGTLLIICGNWSNTGYFSLFAILNYSWSKLNLEDPNFPSISLELLQVS